MRAACVALLSTALGLPAAAEEPAPRCRVQPDGDHVVVSSPADGFGIRLIGPLWSVRCSERDGLLARSPILLVSVSRRDGGARASAPAHAPQAAATARRSDGVVLDLTARWTGARADLAVPERARAIQDLLAVQLDSFVLLDSSGGAALAAFPTE